MNLTLKSIPARYIPLLWPKLKPHLASAFEEAAVTEYDTKHAREFLEKGTWLAIGFFDDEDELHGAITVSFVRYPNECVAFITAIGGKLIANPDTFEQLKAICKTHGAVKLQGYARESVARLWKRLGFENRAILVEAKL
jgi:hypothetical protein